MIANRHECVDADELPGLLAGRLPADRFAHLLQHVETCPRCIEMVEQSSSQASFSWLGRAALEHESGSFNHEPECQAIVGQLLVEPLARSTDQTSVLPMENLGPYRLIKWLGAGGMGAVYLAQHQRLKRLAAIKLLPREKLMQSGWLERFNREMTSIASLEHPHIVRAIDAGDDAGWHFLVMEYLDGLDVGKVCRRLGPLPVATACELIRQAALGLGAIHGLGMTHRDIKPSNLFLTKSGTVKLLDLGLVLSGDSPLTSDERLTTVGHLMGTLPYMAREQLQDASCVDWRADIYSLGATFFHLLTGKPPLGSVKNIAQTIQAISNYACPSIRELRPDIPEPLAQLIDRMLNHSVSERPQSAIEIAEALTSLADPQATAPLAQVAINRADDPVSSNHHSAPRPIELAPTTAPATVGNRTRWPMWVALLLLPLAFVAGIVITVSTDKGTLVIESDEPNVSVKISQGEKVVQALQVEKQPKSLLLSSGKYQVEVSGAEGENLQVSDTQIVLMRGDKQVVKVTKQPATTNSLVQPTESQTSDVNTYQGKPLAYWMDMLNREKDVAMLAQAMQALRLLTETHEERMLAAKKILSISRRLGGIMIGGRPKEGSNVDASGWFMTELHEAYPTFFPEPGMQAIVEELEQGNMQSCEACLVLLREASYQSLFGTVSLPDIIKQRGAIALDAATRKNVVRLDKALKMRGEQMNDQHHLAALQALTRLRYMLTLALGQSPSADPQLVRGANAILRPAEAGLKQVAPQGFPMPALFGLSWGDPLMLYNILPGNPSPIIVLGLLEPSTAEVEVQTLEALTALAQSHPKEVAAGVRTYLTRLTMDGRSFGFGQPAVDTSAKAKLASKLLLEHPGDQLELIKTLFTVRDRDIVSIFSLKDYEVLLSELAYRTLQQASSPNEPHARGKHLIGSYLVAAYGLPTEKVNETIVMLLGQIQERPSSFGKSDRLPSKDEFFALLVNPTDFDREFASRTLHLCMKRLVEQSPRELLEGYGQLLTQGGYRYEVGSYFVDFAQVLNANTPLDRRFDRSVFDPDLKNSFSAVVANAENKPLLVKLEQAHAQALATFLKKNTELNNEAFIGLNILLQIRLSLAAYLGIEPADPDQVRQGLRLMIDTSGKSARLYWPRIALASLFYFTDHYGYDSVSPRVLIGASADTLECEDCQAIKKLFDGVRQAKPEEFRTHFVEYLESHANEVEKFASKYPSNNSVGVFGGTRAPCSGWYLTAIIQPLLDNASTRERTLAAIRRLAKVEPETEQLTRDLFR